MTKYKKPFILITYSLILYFLLLNFGLVSSGMQTLYGTISPFVWGFALAYLLNIPYEYLLNRVFKVTKQNKNYKYYKALALVASYIFFAVIIVCTFLILIPQLVKSINDLSGYYSQLGSLFTNLQEKLTFINFDNSIMNTIYESISSYSEHILKIINDLVPTLLNVAMSTASGIFNVLCAIIFSVYFLVSKEYLFGLVERSFKAFASPKTTSFWKHVVELSNHTFKGFITSRLVDSTIVGIITFIGALIFGFPYALLISFIAGITNIIPVIGPFIGAVPCIFVILIADPIKALWYLLFVIVLQQIDGNIIGPKVTSDSMGLDGIWVMLAVLVGGGLFGVLGALLSVPVFAILLTLYEELMASKIKAKSVAHKKITTKS